MAVLALLSLYDNAHNEGVVRSTGTLKCIMRMAADANPAYHQASAGAFAFLEVRARGSLRFLPWAPSSGVRRD